MSSNTKPTMILDTLSRQVLLSMGVQESKLNLDRYLHDEVSDVYDYNCDGDIRIGDKEYNDVYVSVHWYCNKVEVWFQQTDETEGYSEAELLGTVNNPELRLETVTVTLPPMECDTKRELFWGDPEPSHFDLPSTLKNAGFTQSEISNIVDTGCDGIQTETELWAHWFASHGMCDDEFVSECMHPIVLAQEKKKFLLGIVHRVHNIQKVPPLIRSSPAVKPMVKPSLEESEETFPVLDGTGVEPNPELKSDATITYTTNYPDGQVYEQGKLVNGKKDGEWRVFYQNGQLKTLRDYNNGVKHGTYKRWNSDGTLEFKITYVNGAVQ